MDRMKRTGLLLLLTVAVRSSDAAQQVRTANRLHQGPEVHPMMFEQVIYGNQRQDGVANVLLDEKGWRLGQQSVL